MTLDWIFLKPNPVLSNRKTHFTKKGQIFGQPLFSIFERSDWWNLTLTTFAHGPLLFLQINSLHLDEKLL